MILITVYYNNNNIRIRFIDKTLSLYSLNRLHCNAKVYKRFEVILSRCRGSTVILDMKNIL